jgi:hypothetical protein
VHVSSACTKENTPHRHTDTQTHRHTDTGRQAERKRAREEGKGIMQTCMVSGASVVKLSVSGKITPTDFLAPAGHKMLRGPSAVSILWCVCVCVHA